MYLQHRVHSAYQFENRHEKKTHIAVRYDFIIILAICKEKKFDFFIFFFYSVIPLSKYISLFWCICLYPHFIARGVDNILHLR